MLKQRARTVAAALFLFDLVVVSAAFLLSYWLRNSLVPGLRLPGIRGQIYPLRAYLPLLPLALVIWGGLLLVSGRYRSARLQSLAREAWGVLRACGIAALLFILAIYSLRLDEALLTDDQISRLWVFLFAIASAGLLVAERLSLRLSSHLVRSRGYNYRTVLIVGTGATARALAASLASHPHWGLRLLGFLATEEGERGGLPSPGVLGTIHDLDAVVRQNVVDEVIFAVRRGELDSTEELFLSLEEQGIRTRLALDIFPRTRARIELEEMDGLPLLAFSTTPASPFHLLLKRALDLFAALLALILFLPLSLAVALLIRLTAGGPVLYRQTRCGLNGRLFTLYKFRTMVEDADERRAALEPLNELSGPAFKLRSDPRVTRLGRWLRRSSLDELPQLWNVLRGDMSLVGPRPPIPEEVARYERWQRRRLTMKPGLTCLWQISGRSQLDFDRWMALDLEYIDSWSPLLDLKILLKTIPAVLSGRGAF